MRRIAKIWSVTLLVALGFGVWDSAAQEADEAARVYRSAKILIDNRDYAGAKRVLEPWLEGSPADPQAHYWLAIANERAGAALPALTGYRKTLELLGSAPAPDAELGRLATAGVQRLDEGLRILKRFAENLDREAARLRPQNETAARTVAAAAERLRDESLLAATSRPAKQRAPADAAEFGGRRYKKFDEPMTWHRALAACEQMGGHLATIASAEENDFVRRLAGRRAWIGGSDEAEEGRWVWVDGTPVTWTNWFPGEPNKPEDFQNHIVLNWNDEGGQWHDFTAGARLGFVCEWDP